MKKNNGSQMQIVSYGAGTNSTAMLIGLHERNEKPDIIIFADTGGERPETYAYIENMSKWCLSVGFPSIVTVSEANTLEYHCLRNRSLPSIAYGYKSCSEHYKARPQKRFLKKQGIHNYRFLIGIDAGETRRKKYENCRYPLVEWNWNRDECKKAIARSGLTNPGKSSCFFCPSCKTSEILELKRNHPDLLLRAIAMESNAKLTFIKGLGRYFAWRDIALYDDIQIDLYRYAVEKPCGCFDG